MTDRLSGLLRAVRAEATRAERERIVDLIETWAELDRRAAREYSRHPAMTEQGKRAEHLSHAAERIRALGGEYSQTAGEHHSSVDSECDTVDLCWYDPGPAIPGHDDEEIAPVRLVVTDGAEMTTSSAYLRIEDAERLLADLNDLVEFLSDRRAARQPKDVTP